MATEKKVEMFSEEIGYTPRENRSIIVKYAPENLSDRIVSFFSMEIYVLQLCENEIILLPFNQLSNLKKEAALVIPYGEIKSVTVSQELLNNVISITTDTDTIRLTAQQKELSDLRTSGIYASEFKGLLSVKNWHKENLDATLLELQNLK